MINGPFASLSFILQSPYLEANAVVVARRVHRLALELVQPLHLLRFKKQRPVNTTVSAWPPEHSAMRRAGTTR